MRFVIEPVAVDLGIKRPGLAGQLRELLLIKLARPGINGSQHQARFLRDHFFFDHTVQLLNGIFQIGTRADVIEQADELGIGLTKRPGQGHRDHRQFAQGHRTEKIRRLIVFFKETLLLGTRHHRRQLMHVTHQH